MKQRCKRYIGYIAWLSQALLLTTNATQAWATEIFASTDAAGQTKWATQALDTSYQKAIVTPDAVRRPTTTQPARPPAKSQVRLQHCSVALRPLVNAIAQRYGVDTHLVMAVIEVESGCNTLALSPKGARGLMQLMPATASRYGMRDAKDLYDPVKNLDMGIRHLRDLLAAHGGQPALAIASYNAGANAVAKYRQRIPNYPETMLYVPAVLAKAAQLSGAGLLVSSEPIMQ
jgi:soluble lytic murein transglycosylase-like protein